MAPVPKTGPDAPDRRREVIRAGHVGDIDRARAGLTDADASVREAALGALDRLAGLRADDMARALTDPAPAVRRRAGELSATRPEIELGPLLTDTDPSVVEVAAWACGERGERGRPADVGQLVELAQHHSDALVRESAVAALGAIGDPAGLDAVLGALDGRAALRRRAAIALANFDGPEVEAALRGCLEDRDRQVRQVAEDLLGPKSDSP